MKANRKGSKPAHLTPPKRVYTGGRPYDKRAWRKLSRLERSASPLCVMCLDNDIIQEATEVDHIHPIHDGGAQYDRNNLQSLCKACHGRKTRKEQQRRGEGDRGSNS